MSQVSIPVEVDPREVMRKRTLGDALHLCAELGGFNFDKELQLKLEVDKAQFSRWQSGTEGIVWPKLQRLMDACGNDTPVVWMLGQRGYDLGSLHKLESENEKQNRALREENRILRRALMSGGV
jgi:hypothetical protein